MHDVPKRVRPLVARVTPIPGESLLSLLVRACQANGIPRPSELLLEVGLTRYSGYAAFTGQDRAADLATLLAVDEWEVVARMHSPAQVNADTTLVDWWGATLERRFVADKRRRFAPAALRISPHHRAVWDVRPLSFCPETFQELASTCPGCGRALGWAKIGDLTRCDHCRMSLLDVDAPFVDERIRPRLKEVADLVSPLESVRSAASARYPGPFRHWPPGELFCALVEFGAAWDNPGAGPTSPIGQALMWGQPSLASADLLISGHQVAMGWPSSLTALLERTCAAIRACPPQAELRLRDLGLLARHLGYRRPPTLFRDLIRDTLPSAALEAKAPVRLRGRYGGTLGARPLTMKEAIEASGISNPVLRRLRPEGDCFLGGEGGRGRAIRFAADRLKASAEAYHASVDVRRTAMALGVPAYTIGAFVRARLLDEIKDGDALRMAGETRLILRSSLDLLLFRLSKVVLRPIPGVLRPKERAQAYIDGAPEEHSIGVVRAMARFARGIVLPNEHGEVLVHRLSGEFSAHAWAHALEGVVRGRVIVRYREDGSGPWTRRLIVEPDSLEAWLNGRRGAPPRREVFVTAWEVGLLLGVWNSAITPLLQAGHMPAEQVEGVWRVRLKDVQAFHARWIFAPEIRRRACMSAYAKPDLPEPKLRTGHLRGWARSEIEPMLFSGS